MKTIAVILIVLGAVALAYGGITMTTREKVIDLGPLEVTQEERHSLPLPPVLGGIAIAAGVIMLLSASRRNAVR